MLVAAGAVAVSTQSLDDSPRTFQIRTTDARVRYAVDVGLRHSKTFRTLAARIDTSDVVVYVETDCGMPAGLAGRLTFLSTAGGRRYVIVRLRAGLPMRHLVSILGHELQHAREIAETDTIVDAATLSRAYAHDLGYRTPGLAWNGRAYDSEAAVRAGEDVLREVQAGSRRYRQSPAATKAAQ